MKMPPSVLVLTVPLVLATALVAADQATPRQQPEAEITLYAPEQHDLYDGHFVLSATRVYQVGRLNDPPGGITWETTVPTFTP